MADIELVIKIPEEYYEDIKEIPVNQSTADMLIIKAGTPLPKGHGRLIDVNDLLDRIGLEDNDSNREDNVGEIITLEDVDRIPTITEADSTPHETATEFADRCRECGRDKVLDEIRAEIDKQEFTHHEGLDHWYMTPLEVKSVVFEIIDKYKVESEERK